MILTCPSCETRYQTDPAHFGTEGRKVRCAKCGHVWHQMPAEVPVEPEPEYAAGEEPAPTPVREFSQRAAYAPAVAASAYPDTAPESSPAGRSVSDRLVGAAGWAGLLALVMFIGWSGLRFRQEVATLWPRSASLYSALGMPVNIRGLEIRDLHNRIETEGGQEVLAISGKLANVTGHELSVPPIRITLTDGNKRVLYSWSFSANVATLKPGQAVNFVTHLSSPPVSARHAEAQLADNKE